MVKIIKRKPTKMEKFLKHHKHFRDLPEGYWRDGDDNLRNIKNDMSRNHIQNVIKGLTEIQENTLYCDRKSGDKFGDDVYYGEVFDLLEQKISELEEAL